MKLNLYVVTQNMQESVAFYKQLFQSEPVVNTPYYSGFNISGAMYGIFDAKGLPNPSVTYGSNCAPNIYVEDLPTHYQRVQQLAPQYISPIIENDGYQLFVFTDPDGTALEFYADKKAN